eukprot:356129-Chlamydomonas_euryale.AAC.2
MGVAIVWACAGVCMHRCAIMAMRVCVTSFSQRNKPSWPASVARVLLLRVLTDHLFDVVQVSVAGLALLPHNNHQPLFRSGITGAHPPTTIVQVKHHGHIPTSNK